MKQLVESFFMNGRGEEKKKRQQKNVIKVIGIYEFGVRVQKSNICDDSQKITEILYLYTAFEKEFCLFDLTIYFFFCFVVVVALLILLTLQ